METALSFWHKEAKDETLAIPNIVFDWEMDQINILRFLARLTTTAEYKNLQSRQHLARRVMEALHAMAQDDDI